MYHAELVVADGVTLIKDGMILLPNEIDWGSVTPTEIKLGLGGQEKYIDFLGYMCDNLDKRTKILFL